MPFQFLVPAFLLGLAALAIPILVHLTRKQRAKVVQFPSLMFLERVPFRAESKSRIHHWLLLLLRAFTVALVVAAFARPFFTDPAVAAGAGTGPRELVVLLDRSYSMGIGDRWDRGKEAARDAFLGLGPLDRASLAVFGRNAAVVVRSTSDRERLLSAVDSLQVSDEATSYGPGLKLAQTVLEETELPARELVLVGDFQRAGWTGDEGVRLPAGTAVTPVRLG
ncbi:MAG: BatA domain-containing protein, partial [Gemmatimonadetes bacterium]|nr:BatA domain-containing protein [Gemmatimonadota bacterium]